MTDPSPETTADRLLRKDRRALAAAITALESGQWTDEDWNQLPAPDQPPITVGITGAGGAGKSTLIAALITLLREQQLSVAVLACDPSSPLTGGALLGDRIRVETRPQDSQFYFRSLSTRGATGGVSAVIGDAVRLMAAARFDVVLVESVGAGQDQYGIRQFVDKLLLLLTPGSGDEIQLQKAGLIELADLIAVNKCDLPGADLLIAMLRECLPDIKVIPIVATQAEGIKQLWTALSADAPDNRGAGL